MDRRDFLKALGAGTAVAVVAPSVFATPPEFDAPRYIENTARQGGNQGDTQGTITFSPDSLTVIGFGTAFDTTLYRGQMLVAANDEVLIVDKIKSPTVFEADRFPKTRGVCVQVRTLPFLTPLTRNVP